MLQAPGPTPYGWHKYEPLDRCPKEYQLEEIRKVTTPSIETAEALATGLLTHAGRARWFKLNFKVDWNSIKQTMQYEAENQPLPISVQAQNKALELVRQYIDHYCSYPSPTVIDAEYLLGPAPYLPGGLELHTVRVDDISRYPEAGDSLWIGEAKTTWEAPSKTVRYYSANAGQIIKQVLLWNAAPQGRALHGPIAGVMLDVMQKPTQRSEAKFVRHAIVIENYQLRWFEESERDLREDARKLDWNSYARRRTTSCTRMVAGDIQMECQFIKLCKYGRNASGDYHVGGLPMAMWQPSPGRETPPWE